MRGLLILGCIAQLLLAAVPASAGGDVPAVGFEAEIPRFIEGQLDCPEDIVDCVECKPKVLPIETVIESLYGCL